MKLALGSRFTKPSARGPLVSKGAVLLAFVEVGACPTQIRGAVAVAFELRRAFFDVTYV
jgi:hypothetical protein